MLKCQHEVGEFIEFSENEFHLDEEVPAKTLSNEMKLYMQIRMLSIPLMKCENNVYRPKIHF